MKFRLLLVMAAVLLAAIAFGGPYADLDRRIKGLSPEKVISAVEEFQTAQADKDLDVLMTGDKPEMARAQVLHDYIGIRALLESNVPSNAETPIKEIKSSPLYQKAEKESGDNWLGKEFERLARPQRTSERETQAPTLGFDFLQVLVYVVWFVLALLVAAFLFFAIRYFHLKAKRSVNRTTSAMLDDDEPDRSLDEWLELAAQLEGEGRFREAVRCLYVACLLQFDRNRVARFDRTQTNWEHYRRILNSPTNPANFDFLGPTREFDRLWYGGQTSTHIEVQRFRETYTELTRLLKTPAVVSR